MKVIKVEMGIDTFCLHHPLTNHQAQELISRMDKHTGYVVNTDDYFNDTYKAHDTHYIEDGILLLLEHHSGKPWNFSIVIHPARLSGNDDPAALYPPSKKSFRQLIQRAEELLSPLRLSISLVKMNLSRVDVTVNLYFDNADAVDAYLRILKKGKILYGYHPDFFHEADHKTKDTKRANVHSCKQQSRSAALFAYDKTDELAMVGRMQKEDGHILRLEAQLKRKAFKKLVDDPVDMANVIRNLGRDAEKIIAKQLKRTGMAIGTHYRYEDAIVMVEEKIANWKTKDRILYLLRKVSDSKSLNAAIEKVKKNFDLSPGKITTLLKRLEKLGISPITLPNQSEIPSLPSLVKLLTEHSKYE